MAQSNYAIKPAGFDNLALNADDKILTKEGYKPFKGILQKNENYRIFYTIKTKSSAITVTDGTKVMVEHRMYRYAEDLTYTDSIMVSDGKSSFKEPIEHIGVFSKSCEVYELFEVNSSYHNYLARMTDDSIYTDLHQCLIVDEFAFLHDNLAKEFIASVFPTISSATIKGSAKIILISTPKGFNHFYVIWEKAILKLNDFTPFNVMWDAVPGRDEEFKKTQIATIGLDLWRQEYECVTGETTFEVLDEETGMIHVVTAEELFTMMVNEGIYPVSIEDPILSYELNKQVSEKLGISLYNDEWEDSEGDIDPSEYFEGCYENTLKVVPVDETEEERIANAYQSYVNINKIKQ